MADFGVFTDMHTVCFERLLAAAPERVWEYWTEPELLAHWLGLARLTPHAGGLLELNVSDAVVSGTILECVPPRRLACSWHARLTREDLDGLVMIELQARGAETWLVLRHTAHGVRAPAHAASQWHARLDALDALLRHAPPIDQTGRAEQLFPAYAARAPAA